MGRLNNNASGKAIVKNMFSLTPVMASTKDMSWPTGRAAFVSGDQLRGAPNEAVAASSRETSHQLMPT